MNSSALSSGSLSHSQAQRTSESQDTELTSVGNQTSKILNQMKSELQEQKQQDRLLKELHLKRVQSLRKELDYIKSTEWRYQPIDRATRLQVHGQEQQKLNMLSFLYAFVKGSVGLNSPSRKQETEQEINRAIARIEDAFAEETREESTPEAWETGSVTFVSADYVLIDDYYVFDTSPAFGGLKVGDKVRYIASKDEKQPHKVKKIVSTIDEPLNGDSRAFSECVIGKVVERKDRLLIVEPNNVLVDLNKVRSDFVPVIGDWLRLESDVAFDERNECKIVQVTRIQALRSRLHIATVSSYEQVKGIGVIGRETVFNKRICDSGYVPRVGDKVITDSIESDQGVYKWRSLNVVPMLQVSSRDAKSSPSPSNLSSKKNLPELLREKRGILINGETTVTMDAREEKRLTLTVKNAGDSSQVLRRCCFATKKSQSQLTLTKPEFNAVSVLNPGDETCYAFKCTARFVGSSEELFVFNFKGFEIAKIFTINVKPKTVQRFKLPVKILNNNSSNKIEDFDEAAYVPGIRPCKPPFFVKVRNASFRVPKCYWEIATRNAVNESENDVADAIPCLSSRLRFDSYRDRFHALLYLEEIAQTVDMQRYALESAIMRRSGEYLALRVPGLAEKRPSLLIGDRAVVSFIWDPSQGKLKYEGYVHKVTSQEIFLKFNQRFHQDYNEEDCRVSFRCSHSALQRCHNAINMSINRLGEAFLFPTRVVEKESQVDLVEPETDLKTSSSSSSSSSSFDKQSAHQRNDSLSSESSNASNKSSGTNKSFAKMSVVERLFNVKPMETSLDTRKTESLIGVETTKLRNDEAFDKNARESKSDEAFDKNVTAKESKSSEAFDKNATSKESKSNEAFDKNAKASKSDEAFDKNVTAKESKSSEVFDKNATSKESKSNEAFDKNAKASKSDEAFDKNATSNASKNDEAFDKNATPKEWKSEEEEEEAMKSELRPFVSQVKRRKLLWFRKNLNRCQKEAVKNVLKGRARPLPYVIFGPPGTGKTVTLCETVLQIMSTIPESRLLVATPSNSSANLIAERLLDSGVLKPGDMVRIIAHHCLSSDSIPPRLLPYCATAELADESTVEKTKRNASGPRLNCTMSVLGRHRITIGTCVALGVLNNMGFPRGHFSHVLVDEAGQATEPEIMIPLNFIHSDHGQVILAGDPLQLGPVVQSRIAKNFGLDESFLSRLLRHFPYQRDPTGFEAQYDPRVVTKLVVNYRSLPEILELSSSLFYDSELKATVSPRSSDEAKLLERLAGELPQRKGGSTPAVVFHGVYGENCKDEDSPSWYNPEEATQVYLYLLKLYKCGVSPDDVGIITPYQKQVLQIRELLMELDTELPKISSVEGFQGQERNIIIISAVRSSGNFVNDDIKHSLGFVACPRRLNVAITRARALVIILGNPKLLSRDPYWRSVLIYCINRRSYTGCSFGFDDADEGIEDDTFGIGERIDSTR